MTSIDKILLKYKVLVETHANRFRPQLDALYHFVDESMKEIQNTEREILESQNVELKKIIDALQVDPRILLSTDEFKQFVEILGIAECWWEWEELEDLPAIDKDPTNWLLAKLQLPLIIRDYQEFEDPYAYDDTSTYTLYGYKISLKLGNRICTMEVERRRVYENRCKEFSPEKQIAYYILSPIRDLLRSMNYSEQEIDQLGGEMGILVFYVAKLFELKPTVSVFEYNSMKRIY
ncbi:MULTISPECIES: hypothetical protein [Cylindrospermopsis]|uniref:Uncharacterized protein n=1 Tax=Cylindrospermopsis curvispora GIHE-G1 TaxID=2666332 RepID=A0A7H0F3F9_9CYAN|nr:MULTISPECIES: hypothetical protein [Cylindrospermopsis]MBU6344428.1 hypothetical protein [Cyanobacteria bacterium REEB494]KRH95741.1 hypothetical protein ASL19_10365 [Cylindrospermopsis sp. CR12]MCH4904992.1 hypothetical protein [Cylindrospermopsis raciborskii CHAB3438]MEB3146479.1 hypothetical protein [Cylindrospermopsis raciborskii]QNP30575.1 hypothetical protein IAR63_06020 [Cylindrospermopsis curvispora GIHE-G1]